MIRFPKLNAVYCNVPRTGSNVIRKLLDPPDNTHHVVKTPDFRCPYHGTAWYPEFDDHLIFISVRHPYRRVLSLWSYFKSIIYEFDNPGSTTDPLIIETANRRDWNILRFFDQPTLSDFLREPHVVANLSPIGPWSVESCYRHMPRKPDVVLRLECLQEDIQKIIPDCQTVNQENKSFVIDSWQNHISAEDARQIKETLTFEFEEFDYAYDLNAVKQGKYFI